MAHLHELGLLKNVLAFLVLLALLKSSLLHKRGSQDLTQVYMRRQGRGLEQGAHIFPAKHSTATGAVDVCHRVEASHKQALLLGAQSDVHPAHMTPRSASTTVLIPSVCPQAQATRLMLEW